MFGRKREARIKRINDAKIVLASSTAKLAELRTLKADGYKFDNDWGGSVEMMIVNTVEQQAASKAEIECLAGQL